MFKSSFIGNGANSFDREFQVVGPATENDRSPSYVLLFEESSSQCRLMNGDVDVRGLLWGG